MTNEQNTAFVINNGNVILPCFDTFQEAVEYCKKNDSFRFEIQERSRSTDRLVVAYKLNGVDAKGEPTFRERRNYGSPRKPLYIPKPDYHFVPAEFRNNG